MKIKKKYTFLDSPPSLWILLAMVVLQPGIPRLQYGRKIPVCSTHDK